MIEIDVRKAYNAKESIGADFKIKQGSFISVFGPSGIGKTTVLRMIAGLTRPDEGRIKIGDEVWFDSREKINIPVQKRNIGFVFQEYTVFPNMTVRENVAFGLNQRNDALVDELLDHVDLKKYEGRNPQSLSGGEKQRLALIRALARKPRLLLLDEPFVSLDLPLRERMYDEVIRLYRQFNITTIFVSHELSEVFKLSHEVIMLGQGGVEKQGDPDEVFGSPSLSGKFSFTGEIVEMVQDEVIFIVSVQIGSHIAKSVITRKEAAQLKAGDRVVVSSKAFNPVIIKLDTK